MYRKGVSALIINKKEEVLLVNLESFEEKYFAIPGGGLDEGETLEDAAYREIREELGIEKQSLELMGKSDTPLRVTFKKIKLNRDGKEFIGSDRYFFGFRFIGTDDEIKIREGEVRSFKWVAMKNLENCLLFDHQLEETVEKITEIFPLLKF